MAWHNWRLQRVLDTPIFPIPTNLHQAYPHQYLMTYVSQKLHTEPIYSWMFSNFMLKNYHIIFRTCSHKEKMGKRGLNIFTRVSDCFCRSKSWVMLNIPWISVPLVLIRVRDLGSLHDFNQLSSAQFSSISHIRVM